MQKTNSIKLDIPSLDNLVKEFHEAEGKDKIIATIIAMVIQHRLFQYYKHDFQLDYQKYINEIKGYIHV